MKKVLTLFVLLSLTLSVLTASALAGPPVISPECGAHIFTTHICQGDFDYSLPKKCTLNDVIIDGVLHPAGCTHYKNYYKTYGFCNTCHNYIDISNPHLCTEDWPNCGIWIDCCANSLMQY